MTWPRFLKRNNERNSNTLLQIQENKLPPCILQALWKTLLKRLRVLNYVTKLSAHRCVCFIRQYNK